MRTIFIALVLASLDRAACLPVASDRIVARELLHAVPFLQPLDPGTTLGFSPLPGTQRIISRRELALIARQHGLILSPDAPTPAVCVERALRHISAEEMKAALVAALNMPGAELELVEFSEQAVPPGTLEFRLSGLSKPARQAPDHPVVWRGRVIYDGLRSAMVWARVKILVDRVALVAAEDIAMGAVIRGEQVKEVHERQFPLLEPLPASPDKIAGKVARRIISAGQRFTPGSLDEPKDIFRGDKVRVSVIDGSATLSLDGVAESSGKKGESIVVHNPATGKNFRAVVMEKGQATVRSSPGA